MQFIPQYSGVPMDPYNQYGAGGYPAAGFAPGNGMNPNGPQVVQYAPARPNIDPRVFETPEITMGEESGTKKSLFTVTDAPEKRNTITVANDSDMEVAEKKAKKSTGRKKKEIDAPTVRADGSTALSGDVETGTIYTYNETNAMLHDTLGQIDAINLELIQEFEAVKRNRTLKNKYMVLNNLSENIGSLISNRIATIREINNCISKSNDMDYKKLKDLKAAASDQSDDKYISDLYQAFMANPQNHAAPMQMPQVDQSILGSGIVRANMNAAGSGIADAGYLNYVANLTPEQNMMRYENNPNIKQVVVYDAATGNKFFQVMNVATGEVINNVPTYDNMIMEDTTLDLKAGIAKNININENFPIIVINDNITSQY